MKKQLSCGACLQMGGGSVAQTYERAPEAWRLPTDDSRMRRFYLQIDLRVAVRLPPDGDSAQRSRQGQRGWPKRPARRWVDTPDRGPIG